MWRQRTMPCRSIRKYARFEKNRSSSRTPYSRLTSRLKSLSRSWRSACFALYSLSVGTESTLMGSTIVPARSKPSESSLKVQFSAVDVLVRASVNNGSTTCLRPRNSDSVTSVPAVDGSVKPGATAPTGKIVEAAAVTSSALRAQHCLGDPVHQDGRHKPGHDDRPDGLDRLLGGPRRSHERIDLEQREDHEQHHCPEAAVPAGGEREMRRRAHEEQHGEREHDVGAGGKERAPRRSSRRRIRLAADGDRDRIGDHDF